MSEQQLQLLELVENDYSIAEITTRADMQMPQLFANFVNILKWQIQMQISNIDIVSKVIAKINEMIEDEQITKSIGIKKLRRCKQQIEEISGIINVDPIMADFVNAGLTTLETKIRSEKKHRKIAKKYQATDDIIFNNRDFATTLALINDPSFNINYVNNSHLIFPLITEYITALVAEENCSVSGYYRKLIRKILIIPKFKLTKTEKDNLNSEMTKAIEKVKRNKGIRKRKSIVNQLTDLNKKIKEKEEAFFISKNGQVFNNKRRDFTEEYTISIDNPNTRIHDDALSITHLPNGNYILKIHIVDTNSELSAKPVINNQLLNSLKGHKGKLTTKIPMFKDYPPVETLSLDASASRPTNSLIVEITRKGDIVTHEFVKGMINVNENLIYGEIESKLRCKKRSPQLYTTLDSLIKVTAALKEKNQSKEIYTGLKILSQNKHRLINDSYNAFHRNSNYGYMIVEESMILYNYLLSSYFAKVEYPFIFKNKSTEGTMFQNDDELNRVITKLIQLHHSKEKIVTALIDLYPKTKYSTVNEGNVALQLDSYCNATSPLRNDYDKLGSLALTRCYFQPPSDKEVYEMEEVFPLLSGYMNKNDTKPNLDKEIIQIKKEANLHLNKIRKH